VPHAQAQHLLGEQRNTQVQPGHGKFWVSLEGLFKIFLRVRRALLIHVGDAQRIETIGVRNPAPDDPDFFAAAAFSCANGAVERTSIAAQQIKIEQPKIAPTARR